MGGKHAACLFAFLEFDSMTAIQIAMASPEGQAAEADLANFAEAGIDLMISETHLV